MQLWFVYFTFGMYFIAVWSIIPYLIKPKWFGFTRGNTLPTRLKILQLWLGYQAILIIIFCIALPKQPNNDFSLWGLLIGLIIQLIICIQAGKAATSRYTLLKPTNILLTEQFIKPENKIEFSELNVQHSKEINKPISLRIKSETLFTPYIPPRSLWIDLKNGIQKTNIHLNENLKNNKSIFKENWTKYKNDLKEEWKKTKAKMEEHSKAIVEKNKVAKEMAALEKMSNQPHHLNQFHHLGYEDDKHFSYGYTPTFSIQYESANGEISSRNIDPLDFEKKKYDGEYYYYVNAFCFSAEDGQSKT